MHKSNRSPNSALTWWNRTKDGEGENRLEMGKFENVISMQKFATKITIQYNTTLFYYPSHTQQKLVSRWGVVSSV